MQILCIGAGYVGGPSMAVLAGKCPDIRVTVADINPERIRAWQSEHLPIYEPGLREIVSARLNRNLFFTTDIAANIPAADLIFVCVNTPTKTFGQGAGRASDLQYCERTARAILAHARTDKIVIEKSTVPVRTAAAIARILHSGGGSASFEVLSNPEFLAEGTAIRDLESPDRVLIGGRATAAGRAAVQTLADIYARWIPRERILTMDVWSSELSKLAANAFLAQRISSINSIGLLCETVKADVTEVARAIGMDGRIGRKFLKAGVGFGGSCFRKDLLNLVYLCDSHGLTEAARYWNAVVEMNDHQGARFVERMVTALFNTLAGKRIAVFGCAFKPDTSDTRDSPALRIARDLAAERAQVVITDPQALDNARSELADLGADVIYEPDPYRAAAGAHAIALLTDWESYRALDYSCIHAAMVSPAFLFDGRNLLDQAELHRLGFNVYGSGRPPLLHV